MKVALVPAVSSSSFLHPQSARAGINRPQRTGTPRFTLRGLHANLNSFVQKNLWKSLNAGSWTSLWDGGGYPFG